METNAKKNYKWLWILLLAAFSLQFCISWLSGENR